MRLYLVTDSSDNFIALLRHEEDVQEFYPYYEGYNVTDVVFGDE